MCVAAPPRIHAGVRTLMGTTQTESTRTSEALSLTARELMGYIRGHKSVFRAGEGFKSMHAALCRKNDTGRFFIPQEELETNAHMLPGKKAAEMILEEREKIVEEAKEKVLKVVGKGISEEVVDIVVHDLMYLLRVISYGIAVCSTDFIHDNNMNIMKLLHKEIGVQGKGMTAGISCMKKFVEKELHTDEKVRKVAAACFDKVIKFME